MFVIPILILAVAGVIIYRLLHRQPRAVAATAGAVPVVTHTAPVWPTTPSGVLGVGALVLEIVGIALVNVVQVPYLGWILPVVALGCSAVARWIQHDRSSSVLVVLIVSSLAVVAGLLLLTGEVLIGHG